VGRAFLDSATVPLFIRVLAGYFWRELLSEAEDRADQSKNLEACMNFTVQATFRINTWRFDETAAERMTPWSALRWSACRVQPAHVFFIRFRQYASSAVLIAAITAALLYSAILMLGTWSPGTVTRAVDYVQ